MNLHHIQSTRLSAQDGADRVARRLEKASEPTPADSDAPGYCCEHCDHDEFAVHRASRTSCDVTTTLECSCEASEGIAATVVERFHHQRHHYEALNDEHRTEPGDFDSEDELLSREVVEREITCDNCWATSSSEDCSDDEGEEEELSAEVFVLCGRCGHEVEFGWSHPDRGGRIWPCESADFDPRLCWPEPRYAEDWVKRGWLRAE